MSIVFLKQFSANISCNENKLLCVIFSISTAAFFFTFTFQKASEAYMNQCVFWSKYLKYSPNNHFPKSMDLSLYFARCQHLNNLVYMYSKSPTYKPPSCELSKDSIVRSHLQSHKLVHVSGIHCHLRASFISGCAFVYFTVQYNYLHEKYCILNLLQYTTLQPVVLVGYLG